MKGQMVTIFFSFFLILAIISIIGIESANLQTNQNVNSLIQNYNTPKLEYYNFLNALSEVDSIQVSNGTLNIINSTFNSLYQQDFNNINISEIALNTSNTIIMMPKKPADIISYMPVIISNSQDTATASPFQQMINAPDTVYGNYSNSALDNVEFFYYNGTIIPSWLESYTANNAVWWLKISSIPASSSITVYMGFAPKTTNLFNTVNVGEAPELSNLYGEYDDGANVFNFYSNFAGTSLNTSKWDLISGNIKVDNGLFVTNSTHLISNSFYYPGILEENNTVSSNIAGDGLTYSINSSYSIQENNQPYWGHGNVYEVDDNTEKNLNTNLNYYDSGIFGLEWYDNSIIGYHDYSDMGSTTSTFPITNSQIEIYYYTKSNDGTGTAYLNWVRLRAVPPNNVMPDIYFTQNLP